MPVNQFQFSSSLRADLCGGTLDIWPLYLILNDCQTISLSLQMKTQVTLCFNSSIQIKILNQEFLFKSQQELLEQKDPRLNLIQEVVRFFNPSFNFKLEVCSSSPVGGGLGGSSSVLVGLVKCFSQALNQSLSFLDLLSLCRDLETKVLKSSAGVQDYIIPLLERPPHEISFIQFKALEPQVKHQKASSDLLKNLLLVSTQIEHHSGQINGLILQEALKGENLKQLEECRDISLEIGTCLLKNQFEDIPKLFKREFEVRKSLAVEFPQEVEELIGHLYSHKVLAVKQMGAGSGGSLLLWTHHKEEVQKTCQKLGLHILEDF